ncbi:hypothetical protein EDB92DRAFT_1242075 [Lactarius akahatsu]|uniref:F-box domain-containing protein n=1 Tax=Lactarius akahatsu TaxID=416441 RepID=A0AAD4LCC9_9AGAM|nr:hypothetical protein EDB92DRAFT_1242075 [Lactarius akahatsu]
MLLLRLPLDTLELIAEALDDRPDLLSLALTCSTWKSIIIPRHLEYREILLSVDHLSIWKHLAERPSLAANVRRLVISDSEFYHPGVYLTPISGSRWQLPTTLLDNLPDSSSLYDQQSDYPFIALRNMRLLKTLEFENIYRWCQGSPDVLSLFLAHIPTVEHLVLRSSRSHGTEAETSSDDTQQLWELPNLKSAVLTGMPWERKYLRPFRSALLSTSSLQVLHLPHFVGYGPDIASLLDECRFPSLTELNLGWGWTFDTYPYAQRFLEVHPTIETLTWSYAYNVHLQPGSLPRLKHLSVSHLSFVRALSVAREPERLCLETLGDLFLFSSDLPMDLREIDGTTVRKLSIKFCDSLTTLRAVATFFPSVTHLSIHGSVFIRPKSRWSRAFRKVVRRVFPRRIANRISPICPRVEDVIPLFPELEDLSGSSFPHGIAASSLQDIRARFPKLRRLEPFDL